MRQQHTNRRRQWQWLCVQMQGVYVVAAHKTITPESSTNSEWILDKGQLSAALLVRSLEKRNDSTALFINFGWEKCHWPVLHWAGISRVTCVCVCSESWHNKPHFVRKWYSNHFLSYSYLNLMVVWKLIPSQDVCQFFLFLFVNEKSSWDGCVCTWTSIRKVRLWDYLVTFSKKECCWKMAAVSTVWKCRGHFHEK